MPTKGYLDNDSLPLIGYVEELQRKFGLLTSVSTITRWFKTMGPFKGNLRVTGSFPPGRDSPVTADAVIFRVRKNVVTERYIATG